MQLTAYRQLLARTYQAHKAALSAANTSPPYAQRVAALKLRDAHTSLTLADCESAHPSDRELAAALLQQGAGALAFLERRFRRADAAWVSMAANGPPVI